MSRHVSAHIRSNAWGIAACWLAIMGTAVAAGASDGGKAPDAGAGLASKSASKTVKKLKRKVSGLEQRLAALEGKPSTAIPTTLPPSGPAGGELAGSYPDPTIGIVSGLDLAPDTTAAGGISFAPDANLYRSSANVLRTDDSLSLSGNLTALDDANLGNGFGDEVTVSGWLNLFSPPVAATDCNSSAETGRLIYNPSTNELWVCDDASGWLQIPAS